MFVKGTGPLVVVSNIFFTTKLGAEFQFDKCFSDGLKPPTRRVLTEKLLRSCNVSTFFECRLKVKCHFGINTWALSSYKKDRWTSRNTRVQEIVRTAWNAFTVWMCGISVDDRGDWTWSVNTIYVQNISLLITCYCECLYLNYKIEINVYIYLSKSMSWELPSIAIRTWHWIWKHAHHRLLVAGWLVVKQVSSNMKITFVKTSSSSKHQIFRGNLLVFGGSNKHVECECQWYIQFNLGAVSRIFFFLPLLGEDSHFDLTNVFSDGLKPPTSTVIYSVQYQLQSMIPYSQAASCAVLRSRSAGLEVL